jgi:hypothetical protein
MKRVIIESPFAGDVERNRKYLAAALRDCLKRGEAPFASHAIYTLPGVLDDDILEERKLGITAGFAFHAVADLVVVYTDLGLSPGMDAGIRHALSLGLEVEERTLPGWEKAPHRCDPICLNGIDCDCVCHTRGES